MGLLDSTQDATDTALAVMSSQPLEPEKPTPKHSAWSAVPRAVGSAFLEAGGNLLDAASAYGQVVAAAGGVSPGFNPDAAKNRSASLEAMETLKRDGINWRSDEGQANYNMAETLRPDPLTAGTAENVIFGLTKGLTKAVTAATLTGPVGGAAAFGTSEGMTESEKLAREGVDLETRTKVGLVNAGMNTAGMALPVAGNTLAKTLALAFAGGPASFVAQQAATRSILESANYQDIAQQYDPLDPVGLTIATLLPAGFGAYAYRGARGVKAAGRDSSVAQSADQVASVDAVRSDVTQEHIDAAMVQNLTIRADAESGPVHVDTTNHVDQIQAHPDITAPSKEKLIGMYQDAARNKPAFDSTLKTIADSVSGKLKSAPLKGVDRAVAKISSDYGGDAGKIKDLLRATIEVGDAEGAMNAATQIAERFQLQPGSRNLFDPASKTIDGYRDAKFNVMIDGHVAEVQINMPEMLAAKKFAHSLYEERSAILREIGDGLATKEQQRQINELNEKMRAIYNPAWEAAQARASLGSMARKSDSDTSVPLRYADSAGKDLGGTVSHAAEKRPAASTPSETGTPSTSKNSAAISSTSEHSIDPSQPTIKDGHIDSVVRRAEDLKASRPDMPVAIRQDGSVASAAEEIEAIRREAREGTDTTLGADDAPLLKVAAECLLSRGG